MLDTLTEIGSPPPGNPPPPDKGLNDSVYANLDNLVREKTVTFAPVLDPPSVTAAALAATTVAPVAPATPTPATSTVPAAPATPTTGTTTTVAPPLKKRNNIPSLLNTADSLREQVESAEMSK